MAVDEELRCLSGELNSLFRAGGDRRESEGLGISYELQGHQEFKLLFVGAGSRAGGASVDSVQEWSEQK
ncbi:hypothetical protein CASFOL_026338 [Castilleja foliolosa]|uniref:Uncharacterized protein n=1 Tax=Castilleja foliolosa TaxID=1961234 RepID=A0ABD3CIG6_9LAMI